MHRRWKASFQNGLSTKSLPKASTRKDIPCCSKAISGKGQDAVALRIILQGPLERRVMSKPRVARPERVQVEARSVKVHFTRNAWNAFKLIYTSDMFW